MDESCRRDPKHSLSDSRSEVVGRADAELACSVSTTTAMAGPLAVAALAAVDVDLQSGVTKMNPLAFAARWSEARRPLFAETSGMEGGVFESALAAVDDDLQ